MEWYNRVYNDQAISDLWSIRDIEYHSKIYLLVLGFALQRTDSTIEIQVQDDSEYVLVSRNNS